MSNSATDKDDSDFILPLDTLPLSISLDESSHFSILISLMNDLESKSDLSDIFTNLNSFVEWDSICSEESIYLPSPHQYLSLPFQLLYVVSLSFYYFSEHETHEILEKSTLFLLSKLVSIQCKDLFILSNSGDLIAISHPIECIIFGKSVRLLCLGLNSLHESEVDTKSSFGSIPGNFLHLLDIYEWKQLLIMYFKNLKSSSEVPNLVPVFTLFSLLFSSKITDIDLKILSYSLFNSLFYSFSGVLVKSIESGGKGSVLCPLISNGLSKCPSKFPYSDEVFICHVLMCKSNCTATREALLHIPFLPTPGKNKNIVEYLIKCVDSWLEPSFQQILTNYKSIVSFLCQFATKVLQMSLPAFLSHIAQISHPSIPMIVSSFLKSFPSFSLHDKRLIIKSLFFKHASYFLTTVEGWRITAYFLSHSKNIFDKWEFIGPLCPDSYQFKDAFHSTNMFLVQCVLAPLSYERGKVVSQSGLFLSFEDALSLLACGYFDEVNLLFNLGVVKEPCSQDLFKGTILARPITRAVFPYEVCKDDDLLPSFTLQSLLSQGIPEQGKNHTDSDDYRDLFLFLSDEEVERFSLVGWELICESYYLGICKHLSDYKENSVQDVCKIVSKVHCHICGLIGQSHTDLRSLLSSSLRQLRKWLIHWLILHSMDDLSSKNSLLSHLIPFFLQSQVHDKSEEDKESSREFCSTYSTKLEPIPISVCVYKRSIGEKNILLRRNPKLVFLNLLFQGEFDVLYCFSCFYGSPLQIFCSDLAEFVKKFMSDERFVSLCFERFLKNFENFTKKQKEETKGTFLHELFSPKIIDISLQSECISKESGVFYSLMFPERKGRKEEKEESKEKEKKGEEETGDQLDVIIRKPRLVSTVKKHPKFSKFMETMDVSKKFTKSMNIIPNNLIIDTANGLIMFVSLLKSTDEIDLVSEFLLAYNSVSLSIPGRQEYTRALTTEMFDIHWVRASSGILNQIFMKSMKDRSVFIDPTLFSESNGAIVKDIFDSLTKFDLEKLIVSKNSRFINIFLSYLSRTIDDLDILQSIRKTLNKDSLNLTIKSALSDVFSLIGISIAPKALGTFLEATLPIKLIVSKNSRFINIFLSYLSRTIDDLDILQSLRKTLNKDSLNLTIKSALSDVFSLIGISIAPKALGTFLEATLPIVRDKLSQTVHPELKSIFRISEKVQEKEEEEGEEKEKQKIPKEEMDQKTTPILKLNGNVMGISTLFYSNPLISCFAKRVPFDSPLIPYSSLHESCSVSFNEILALFALGRHDTVYNLWNHDLIKPIFRFEKKLIISPDCVIQGINRNSLIEEICLPFFSIHSDLPIQFKSGDSLSCLTPGSMEWDLLCQSYVHFVNNLMRFQCFSDTILQLVQIHALIRAILLFPRERHQALAYLCTDNKPRALNESIDELRQWFSLWIIYRLYISKTKGVEQSIFRNTCAIISFLLQSSTKNVVDRNSKEFLKLIIKMEENEKEQRDRTGKFRTGKWNPRHGLKRPNHIPLKADEFELPGTGSLSDGLVKFDPKDMPKFTLSGNDVNIPLEVRRLVFCEHFNEALAISTVFSIPIEEFLDEYKISLQRESLAYPWKVGTPNDVFVRLDDPSLLEIQTEKALVRYIDDISMED
ncbi:hypothetical protein ADUPG1_009587, partial [Aduncisulcus paluster]